MDPLAVTRARLDRSRNAPVIERGKQQIGVNARLLAALNLENVPVDVVDRRNR